MYSFHTYTYKIIYFFHYVQEPRGNVSTTAKSTLCGILPVHDIDSSWFGDRSEKGASLRGEDVWVCVRQGWSGGAVEEIINSSMAEEKSLFQLKACALFF